VILDGISRGWPAILSSLKSLLDPFAPIPPSALASKGFRRAMNIDNFKPAIVYTIYIASTPEKVWQALTTAEFSRQYLFRLRGGSELKVGGAFAARAPEVRSYQRRSIGMRLAAQAHHHLERQLACAGREARPNACDLRDRSVPATPSGSR